MIWNAVCLVPLAAPAALAGRLLGQGQKTQPGYRDAMGEFDIAPRQQKKNWSNLWGLLPEGHEGGITGGSREFPMMVNPGEVIVPLDQLDRVIASVLNVPSLSALGAGAGGAGGNSYQFSATLNLSVPDGDRSKGRELLDYGASVMRQQFRELADELETDVVR